MGKKVLVTGGAGFIGSHIVDALVERGHQVTILDILHPQVHGAGQLTPQYVNREAEFIVGDIRDADLVAKAIKDKEVIFHQAAAVGVGQSMYRIREYTDINTLGGATLLDAIVREKNRVEKIIVASSMSIYGEGKYLCRQCGEVNPKLRSQQQLEKREWEMRCPVCASQVSPLPTDEDKPLYPTSIYAITKRDHEEMFLVIGRAYRIPTVALRYFNVYGPRQSLSNPYTGVAAIFSSRLLNNKPPLIFEDGLQSRDFIHVSDIAQANILAMEKQEADYEIFNVGTGRSLNLLDICAALRERIGGPEPEIVNRFRAGDIRHCFADISKISRALGFKPRVAFEQGIEDLANWARQQNAADRLEQAAGELESKGLTL